MLLKNNAKCLITVNGPITDDGYPEFYHILPGENPAVDVPDDLCKSDFVKHMIATGQLLNLGESPKEIEAGDDGEVEELREQCKLLGINVDKRWGVERLKAEIDKA